MTISQPSTYLRRLIVKTCNRTQQRNFFSSAGKKTCQKRITTDLSKRGSFSTKLYNISFVIKQTCSLENRPSLMKLRQY